jgi:hypothetical protein
VNRKAPFISLLVFGLAALSGCSSQPSATESKKAEAALDKIHGKAELQASTTASDAALNAGGHSVYLWEGTRRYRLFLRNATEVTHGKEYVAEGVHAQKVIDEIGDPDQGKTGYPLQTSCERVVKMAWTGLAFDTVDAQASVLRAQVKRYPARRVFLVTRIRPATEEEIKTAAAKTKKGAAEEKEVPEVVIPADKQKASLVEGAAVQTAPLWEPNGGTARCKVLIDTEGKISELETGAQLCEIVDWSKFRYQPPVQGGKPVNVKTEVEIKFEPRK